MTAQELPAAIRSGRRRFLVPEVIQTSGMDCGPAALKALLGGFHVQVSYGRLREACHTDVDGTSIDALEDLAQQLGLDARQIVLPHDHVLLTEAHALPAIVVTRNAAGGAHFVVLWALHGPFVQVMNPAHGRLWLPRPAFLRQLFSHTAVVPASAWRQWAGSEAFLGPLRRRLSQLPLSNTGADRHLRNALSDESWRGLASLDATVRMLAALHWAHAIDRSTVAAALEALAGSARDELSTVPEQYWAIKPGRTAADGTEQLRFRGAVLLRAGGPCGTRASSSARPFTTEHSGRAPRSAELAAALREAPARPIRQMLKAVRADGPAGPAIAAGAIAIAATGVVVEAVLLRSVLDVSTLLNRGEQGLAAGLALALFSLALLAVEVLIASVERRAGSHLEARLRVMFLAKMPRLADSYFQSRPVSDMVERSHSLHVLRTLPPLAVRVLRVTAELVVTTAAIVWLDPVMAWLAILALVAAAAIPLAGNAVMSERDLKVRTHGGALARFHLEALLGRTAIEAHGAEATIEREHDVLLAEWAKASRALRRASITVEGLQLFVGFGVAACILFGHLGGSHDGGNLLLLTYWVLNLPALGHELALAAREYPAHRSTVLRLLEPLAAPEIGQVQELPLLPAASNDRTPGVAIAARAISVQAAGQAILDHMTFEIAPGSHVAIVGASGAGKSTLVGTLLGWHRPASGELLVDSEPLSGRALDQLRRETAWVDPTVHIWNRSMLENLLYGAGDPSSVGAVLEASGLMPVLAKLPDGLATALGESGTLISAGEGQRVRLARAMMRHDARLVLLDEPFVGLERERRRALLAQARQRWSGRTLLYVTHDVSETRAFDRVIVLERGRIVEDGEPHQLAHLPSSRYRRLLQAHDAMHVRLTSGPEWRRVTLEAGRIVQDHTGTVLEHRA